MALSIPNADVSAELLARPKIVVMLSREDNELLCRVGPGTPMGDLMRHYWMPALLSSELPAPDSDPMRVMLLGEQLIAFRDTNGQVGLVQNNCPHRGASLFCENESTCLVRAARR